MLQDVRGRITGCGDGRLGISLGAQTRGQILGVMLGVSVGYYVGIHVVGVPVQGGLLGILLYSTEYVCRSSGHGSLGIHTIVHA